MEAIKRDFGSFDQMKTQLSTASVGVQGSGWGWLGYNKQTKRLQIAACPNQDPLEATTGICSLSFRTTSQLTMHDFVTGLVPLFGIDVWEHAYYLQYKNVRPDYVKEIFKKANWADVASRLAKASK